MIDLKQKELNDWQERNFGNHPDDILKCALGIAEEAGEVCHHVLKGTQRIRSGLNGINKAEVADGVADTLIYGLQLLSLLGLDAEKEISAVIDKVLRRDWKANPAGDIAKDKAEKKIDILYELARLSRNTDGLFPSTHGSKAGRLLIKLRGLDEDRYNKEVMGL